MSWAKLDDHANEHPKLLKAGANAAWLWACGLMYCNRQTRKNGRIPKVKVGLLYPGIGKREATKLVKIGLWVDDGDDYVVHDYKPWNPELREKRAEAGRVGGRRSGESRRTKQTKQSSKQTASENSKQTEASSRSILDPPHPTPPQKDPPQPPQGGPVVCPSDLRLTSEQFDALSMNTGLTRYQADSITGHLVAKWVDGSKRMPLDAWRRYLSTSIQREASNGSGKWPRAAAADNGEALVVDEHGGLA